MARVRIAKATSGAAFVSKKKACEARLAAQEAGEEVEPCDDIFELQHHHLLRCLERATVSIERVCRLASKRAPTSCPVRRRMQN